MRGLLIIAAFIICQVHNAAASEIVAEARIVEVDRISLRQLHPGVATSFIMNVSESAGRSFVEGPQSRTVQNFQLKTVDKGPVQFRISSRVGPMDVGIDFAFTARVSDKREIKVTMTGQTGVRHRQSDTAPLATVFTGELVRDEITTAEGASILFAGFVTERDAGRLGGIEAVTDSPILKSLFGEKRQSVELVLLLTLHIVRPPAPTDVTFTPAPTPPQNAYTVQVGAFQSRANAATLFADLGRRYPDVFIQEPSSGERLYRVRVGRLANVREVKQLEGVLRNEGFTTFVAQLR
jgi:Flp pilus assembly secretin CpaC